MNSILAILLLASFGVAVRYYLSSTDGSEPTRKPLSSPAPSVAAKVAPVAAQAGVINVKSQHVAAITAAILAATHGRGRILSIVPQASPLSVASDATRRWREAGIVAGVGRRVVPSWKR